MTATRAWRARKQRYALHSESCPVCSAVQFPPREVCNICGAAQHLPLVAVLPAVPAPAALFTANAVLAARPGQRIRPS